MAIAAVVVLTACGARIDTIMNVGDDGTGSRVMVATLSGDDLAKLNNGSAAIDASIRKNLPGELTYSGITPTADGGATVTLTLAFNSPSDYKEKVKELLQKDDTDEAILDFAVTDSLLLKGIRIDEDFGSYDLLKWMFDGLIADGVVAESDTSNMYEVGSSVLNFGGSSVDQNGLYDYSDVVDNGFTDVAMVTDIADPDKITRTITYSVAEAKYDSHKALYDEFFAKSTPPGADLSVNDDGTWEMTFSGDAKAISKNTAAATGGERSELSVKTDIAADDPATLTTTVTDAASCTSICAGGAHIQDTIMGGPGYTPKSIEVDTSADAPVMFENIPAITSADAKLKFGIFGAVTGTVKFVVPNKSVALVGDGFSTLFRPAKSVGTLTSEKGPDETTFTTVIKGDDAETFAAAYEQWASGSVFSVIEQDGSGLFGREMSYDIDPGLSSILNRHTVSGSTTASVVLPLGHSVSSPSGETSTKSGLSGTTVTSTGADVRTTFQAGGPTFAGLVSLAVLGLLLLAGVLLLIKCRSKVGGVLRGTGIRMAGVGTRLTDEGKSSDLVTLSRVVHEPSSRNQTDGSLLNFPATNRSSPLTGSLLDVRTPQIPASKKSLFAADPGSRPIVSARPAMFDPAAPSGNH